MLRRDFISKIIEQLVNAVARLLELNTNDEPQEFLDQFDELLRTYFSSNSSELELLLDSNEERDALLLDEKLKNYHIRMFLKTGFVFVRSQQISKAETCKMIIERIQQSHSNLYEFPTLESVKIEQDLYELKNLIQTF